MTTKKHITTFANRIFFLIVLLFILDTLTDFNIENQSIKSFSYIDIMYIAPIILMWDLWFYNHKKTKIVSCILPFFTVLGILLIGPVNIIFSSASWTTQKVLTKKPHKPFKKIEYQMQDMGALGYNGRTVEFLYITHWFMVVHDINQKYIN